MPQGQPMHARAITNSFKFPDFGDTQAAVGTATAAATRPLGIAELPHSAPHGPEVGLAIEEEEGRHAAQAAEAKSAQGRADRGASAKPGTWEELVIVLE